MSIVNIQSQRFELSGADAISFLTLDGFTVSAEGTLEFNIDADHAALLTQEVGDMDDILQKIILPAARGFSRLEGSKKSATEFIVGERDYVRARLYSRLAPNLSEVLTADRPGAIFGLPFRESEVPGPKSEVLGLKSKVPSSKSVNPAGGDHQPSHADESPSQPAN